MELNSNEKLILSSNNNQIVLTSQRLVQTINDSIKTMDLKDYTGYEVIKKRSNYYLIFTIILIVIDIYLLAKCINFNNDANDIKLKSSLFFTMIALFFFYGDQTKIIKITGKYNSIEFFPQSMKQTSIDKLIKNIQSAKAQL